MNPAAAAALTSGIAQGLVALLNVYRVQTGKPEGWIPGASDWDDIELWAMKTPEEIKAEGVQRVGSNLPTDVVGLVKFPDINL